MRKGETVTAQPSLKRLPVGSKTQMRVISHLQFEGKTYIYERGARNGATASRGSCGIPTLARSACITTGSIEVLGSIPVPQVRPRIQWGTVTGPVALPR